VRVDRDGIEHVAGHVLLHRQEIGRYSDGKIARMVRQLTLAVEVGLVTHEGHARHALDATGERMIDHAGGDRRARLPDRRKSGDAVIVDGVGRRRIRQPGAEFRDQRDVAALGADLADAAEGERTRALAYVADALLQRIDQPGYHILRLDRGERAVRPRLAAWRADGIVDVDGHVDLT
jgi:hypothetical protein